MGLQRVRCFERAQIETLRVLAVGQDRAHAVLKRCVVLRRFRQRFIERDGLLFYLINRLADCFSVAASLGESRFLGFGPRLLAQLDQF